MTPPITATRPRTLGGCLQCAAGIPHTRHDTALPVATRTTITAAIPLGDPDLPGYLTGYLTEPVPTYPAI